MENETRRRDDNPDDVGKADAKEIVADLLCDEKVTAETSPAFFETTTTDEKQENGTTTPESKRRTANEKTKTNGFRVGRSFFFLSFLY
ncbi:unnamed protein product [Linum trigynum]|uniref:Uncharacterized protein n=1 Tax=Linum trigynum TaxID=586398 RepID=A0AAV2DZ06_9ROSI